MEIAKIILFTVIYRTLLIVDECNGENTRVFSNSRGGSYASKRDPNDLVLDIGEKIHPEGIMVEHDGDDMAFTRVHTVKEPFKILEITYGDDVVWKANGNDSWCESVSTHFLNKFPLVAMVYLKTKKGKMTTELFSMQGGNWVSSEDRKSIKPAKIELSGSKDDSNKIAEIQVQRSILRDDLLFGNMVHVHEYDEKTFRKSKTAVLDISDVDHGALDITVHTAGKFTFYELSPKVGHSLEKIVEGTNLVSDFKPGEKCVKLWHFPETNVASVVRLVIANSRKFYHKVLVKYGRTWEPVGLDVFHSMIEESEDEHVVFDATREDVRSKFFVTNGKPAAVPYTVYTPNLQIKAVGVYHSGAQIWRARPNEYCICIMVDYGKIPSYISITVLDLKGVKDLFFVRAGAIWKNVEHNAYPSKHKLHVYSFFYNANITYICRRMIEELNKDRIIEYHPRGGASQLRTHYDYRFYKNASFNTSVFTLDVREEGFIKRVKCTSKEGTFPTRLFYGKDIIWETRSPNEYCSAAVVYFIDVFPEFATIHVSRPELNEVLRRQRKDGKWVTIYKDDYKELLENLGETDIESIKSSAKDDELVDAEFEDDRLNVFLEDSSVFKAEKNSEYGITYIKYTPGGGFKLPVLYSEDKVVRVHISSDSYCSEVIIYFDENGPKLALVHINDSDVEVSVYHENASGIWKSITAQKYKQKFDEMKKSPGVPEEITGPQSWLFSAPSADESESFGDSVPRKADSSLNKPTKRVVPFTRRGRPRTTPRQPIEDIIDLKEELSHRYVDIKQDGDYNMFTRVFNAMDILKVVRVMDGGKNIWKATEHEESCFKITADYLGRIPMFVTLYIKSSNDGTIVKSLSIKGDQWVVMDSNQPTVKIKHRIDKCKAMSKSEEIGSLFTQNSVLHDEYLLISSSSDDMGRSFLYTKDSAVLNLEDIDTNVFIVTSYGDDTNKTYKIIPNTRYTIYMIVDGHKDVWGSDQGDTCVAVWYFSSRKHDPMVRVLIVNSKKFYHKIFRKFHSKWTQICLDTYYLSYEKKDELNNFDINIREPSTAYYVVDGRRYGVPYRLFLMSAHVKLTRIVDGKSTIWHSNTGEYCIDFIINYGKSVTYITATILRKKGALVIFFIKDGGKWATMDEKYYLDRYKLYSYDSVSESEIRSQELLTLQKTGPVTLYLDDVDTSIFTEEQLMDGDISCFKYICKSGTQISKIVSYNDVIWEVLSEDDYCTETTVHFYEMEPQFVHLEYKDSKNSSINVYRLREYGSWVPAMPIRYESLLHEFKNDIERVELNIVDVDEEVFNLSSVTRGSASRQVISMKPNYRLDSVCYGTNRFWKSESGEYCKRAFVYLEGKYPHLCSLIISRFNESETLYFRNINLNFEPVKKYEYDEILEDMKAGKFLPKAKSESDGLNTRDKASIHSEAYDCTLNILDLLDNKMVESTAMYLDSVYTTLLFPKKSTNIVRIIEEHDVIWESKNQEKCVYVMCHHHNNNIYLIDVLKETPSELKHKFFWKTPTDSWKKLDTDYGKKLGNSRVSIVSNDRPILNIRSSKNYKCKLVEFDYHGLPAQIHIPQRVCVNQIVDNGTVVFKGTWERCIMVMHHTYGTNEFLYLVTLNNFDALKIHYYLKRADSWKSVDSIEYNQLLSMLIQSKKENEPSHNTSHMDTGALGPKVQSSTSYTGDPAITVDLSQTNVVNEVCSYDVKKDLKIYVKRSVEGNDFYRYTHKLDGERRPFTLFSLMFGEHKTSGIGRINGITTLSVFYWKFAPDVPLLIEMKKVDGRAFYYSNVGDSYKWKRIEEDNSKLQSAQIIGTLRKLSKKLNGSLSGDTSDTVITTSHTETSYKALFPGYTLYSKTYPADVLSAQCDEELPVSEGSEVTVYFYGEGNYKSPSLLYVENEPKGVWYSKDDSEWKEEYSLVGKTPSDTESILTVFHRLSKDYNLGYILPDSASTCFSLPSALFKPSESSGTAAIDISKKPTSGNTDSYTLSNYPGSTITVSKIEDLPDFHRYKHTLNGEDVFSLLCVLYEDNKTVGGIDRIENIRDLSVYYWKYNLETPLFIEITRQNRKKIYYKNLDRDARLNWFGPFTEDVFSENLHTTLVNWNNVLNLVAPIDISVKHGSYCHNEELDKKTIIVSARNLGGELSGFSTSTHNAGDSSHPLNIVSISYKNKRQNGFTFPILDVRNLTVYFGRNSPDRPLLIHIDSDEDVWYRKVLNKDNAWEKDKGLYLSSGNPDVASIKKVLLKLSPASFESDETEEVNASASVAEISSAKPSGNENTDVETKSTEAEDEEDDDEEEEEEEDDDEDDEEGQGHIPKELKTKDGHYIDEEYSVFVTVIYWLMALIFLLPIFMLIRQMFQTG